MRLKTLIKSTAVTRKAADGLRYLYRRVFVGYRFHSSIPGRIHFNDASYHPGHPDHYRKVGESALELINKALQKSGSSFRDTRSCLDFPCGYGRVLRYLRTELLPEMIDACDIDHRAVRFCAKEFGVAPILSHADLSRVRFPREYDLIWIGSLLTHMNREDFDRVLDLVFQNLIEGGVLVFSTHGDYSLECLHSYGIDEKQKDVIRQSLEPDGFHFIPYPGDKGYGISFSRKPFVCDRVDRISHGRLRLVEYFFKGWDDHQDVYAYRKLSSESKEKL